jgi:hypothetical protein
VVQDFLLLEPLKQSRQHLRAQGTVGFGRKQRIEEALRVFRLVQVVINAALLILN